MKTPVWLDRMHAEMAEHPWRLAVMTSLAMFFVFMYINLSNEDSVLTFEAVVRSFIAALAFGGIQMTIYPLLMSWLRKRKQTDHGSD